MKLALIRCSFSATGGAELYLQRLLAALAQAGHEVHLFAESWAETPAGVKLHPVRCAGSRAHKPRLFAEAVQRELARDKFDCVFSLERTLGQDVYRAGDGLHRVWLQRRREFAPWWRKSFIGVGGFHRTMLELEEQTFNLQNTRHIIANSEMVKREILENFRFPPERIHLVRNGVDVVRFQGGNREATRARFGVKEGDFLLLFVGSGWERKGLKYLLQAMDRLLILQGLDIIAEELIGKRISDSQPFTFGQRNVKLLVVGQGRPPARVPDDIIFAGPMRDVENAYAAADLFVFLPIYEPSANVVVEARAAGLPVITSAQNGACELIEESESGTVIENPADVDAVVKAIDFWWSRRFRASHTTEHELSLERNVAETLAILELAAKEKRG
jgi:UDP-glucose:(heptosyl)LPS alpha-1,3-glucosyltransferase